MYVFTLNQSDSERKYAATICKSGIYLTRFLSEIDRLVYFQFQIQYESSIEDLNSGLLSGLRTARSRPANIKLRALFILKLFRSFNDITEAKQNFWEAVWPILVSVL